MNPKHTWTLVALAVLGLGFILLVERHWRDGSQPEPAPRILPQLDPATVKSVQVRPAGQPEIRADLTANGWQLTRPLNYPADPNAVGNLLAALRQLNSDHQLSASEVRDRRHAEKEFGFDPPQFSILIQQGEDVTPVLLGSLTALKDQVFVQVVGQPGIYLASAELLRVVPRRADDWRSTTLLDLKALSFDRVAVSSGAKAFEFERDAASHQWRLIRPLEARADSPKLEALLEQLQALRVTAFVSDDPKAELESYGLKPPEWALAFARGTNLLAALQFGRSPTNHPGEIFARRADGTAVVRVPQETLAGWRAPLDDFRDRRLLTLAPGQAGEIEVHGPDSFTVRQTGNDAWRVTEGTNVFAADLALVNDLLLNLSTLEVAQFVKTVVTPLDLPTYGLAPAARQYTLRSFVTNALGAVTNEVLADLLFGSSQDGLIFVRRADENSVYAVKERDFQRLPVVAWQLRDRRVFHFGENDLAGVTLRLAGRITEMTRTGTNQWTLPTNAPAGLNDLALDEAMHQLGGLTCVGWLARGPEAPARLGFGETAPALTLNFTSGPPITLQLGRLSPRHFPLGATVLADQMTVFEVPWTVFQTLREALGLPSPPP